MIVHTREWNEHLNRLKCLFERFRDALMTVKSSKCLTEARKVDFLGDNVGDELVGLHNDNVEKIKRADRPQTKREVRSFLGLTGYYRFNSTLCRSCRSVDRYDKKRVPSNSTMECCSRECI